MKTFLKDLRETIIKKSKLEDEEDKINYKINKLKDFINEYNNAKEIDKKLKDIKIYKNMAILFTILHIIFAIIYLNILNIVAVEILLLCFHSIIFLDTVSIFIKNNKALKKIICNRDIKQLNIYINNYSKEYENATIEIENLNKMKENIETKINELNQLIIQKENEFIEKENITIFLQEDIDKEKAKKLIKNLK